MPWTLLQSGWLPLAQLAKVPMQDLLAPGSKGRISEPGTLQPGN